MINNDRLTTNESYIENNVYIEINHKRSDEEILFEENIEKQLSELEKNLSETKLSEIEKNLSNLDASYNRIIHKFTKFILKDKWLMYNINSQDCEQLRKLAQDTEEILRLKDRILFASREACSFLLSNKKILWITGSRSQALIGIHQATQKLFSTAAALIPTGTLLAHNIVPLAGELHQGIGKKGMNQKYLSGVIFSSFESAESYADVKGKRIMQFNKNNEFECITKIVNEKWAYYSTPDFVARLKIAALRLLQYGNLSADEKSDAKFLVEKIKCKYQQSEFMEEEDMGEINNILQFFECIAPIKIDEDQQQCIDEPFPILWACTDEHNKEYIYPKSDICGEVGVLGSIILGKEISVAFTEKEKINFLKNQLFKLGVEVQVMSFDALYFIASQQLNHNRYGVHITY